MPGLRDRLVQEGPQLRPHINVFVDGEPGDLDTPVAGGSTVHVIPAVSGGRDRQLSQGSTQPERAAVQVEFGTDAERQHPLRVRVPERQVRGDRQVRPSELAGDDADDRRLEGVPFGDADGHADARRGRPRSHRRRPSTPIDRSIRSTCSGVGFSSDGSMKSRRPAHSSAPGQAVVPRSQSSTSRQPPNSSPVTRPPPWSTRQPVVHLPLVGQADLGRIAPIRVPLHEPSEVRVRVGRGGSNSIVRTCSAYAGGSDPSCDRPAITAGPCRVTIPSRRTAARRVVVSEYPISDLRVRRDRRTVEVAAGAGWSRPRRSRRRSPGSTDPRTRR